MDNYLKPRHTVRAFSEYMEKRLQANDHRGGWKLTSINELHFRAQKALDDVRDAIAEGNAGLIVKNAADVANLLMMIADNAVDGVAIDDHPGSLNPSHRQLAIAFGKFAAGYSPGCEEWNQLDQDALMFSYHGDERTELPFNG